MSSWRSILVSLEIGGATHSSQRPVNHHLSTCGPASPDSLSASGSFLGMTSSLCSGDGEKAMLLHFSVAWLTAAPCPEEFLPKYSDCLAQRSW